MSVPALGKASEKRAMESENQEASRFERRFSATTYRIAHIDTAMDFRGGQQQLLRLARELNQRGHEQLIVCPEGSSLEQRSRKAGFRAFALPAHDPAHAHGVLLLRQCLLPEPPDIVHAHDGKGQTISWLATVGMPVRRVASRQVMFRPKKLAGGSLIHRLKYEYTCHGVIAVCQHVKELLVSAGVSSSKIEVIPVGIDWPEKLPAAELRSRVRARWGIGEDGFVVGHLGTFTHEKGQDITIGAAILLANKLPSLRVLLAGDATAQALSRLASRLREAAGRVRLMGYLENPWEFLAGLDLYIMPSRAEGLPASVLLAMASGLAVVASRVGGLPEIVEEGRTGWLVPPESPQALAEAVFDAASNRSTLREYGGCGRARARQFSVDQMIARTEAFYARLVGAR
jgi:glycosyltransferase involved in cell wall biosynthesis